MHVSNNLFENISIYVYIYDTCAWTPQSFYTIFVARSSVVPKPIIVCPKLVAGGLGTLSTWPQAPRLRYLDWRP